MRSWTYCSDPDPDLDPDPDPDPNPDPDSNPEPDPDLNPITFVDFDRRLRRVFLVRMGAGGGGLEEEELGSWCSNETGQFRSFWAYIFDT